MASRNLFNVVALAAVTVAATTASAASAPHVNEAAVAAPFAPQGGLAIIRGIGNADLKPQQRKEENAAAVPPVVLPAGGVAVEELQQKVDDAKKDAAAAVDTKNQKDEEKKDIPNAAEAQQPPADAVPFNDEREEGPEEEKGGEMHILPFPAPPMKMADDGEEADPLNANKHAVRNVKAFTERLRRGRRHNGGGDAAEEEGEGGDGEGRHRRHGRRGGKMFGKRRGGSGSKSNSPSHALEEDLAGSPEEAGFLVDSKDGMGAEIFGGGATSDEMKKDGDDNSAPAAPPAALGLVDAESMDAEDKEEFKAHKKMMKHHGGRRGGRKHPPRLGGPRPPRGDEEDAEEMAMMRGRHGGKPFLRLGGGSHSFSKKMMMKRMGRRGGEGEGKEDDDQMMMPPPPPFEEEEEMAEGPEENDVPRRRRHHGRHGEEGEGEESPHHGRHHGKDEGKKGGFIGKVIRHKVKRMKSIIDAVSSWVHGDDSHNNKPQQEKSMSMSMDDEDKEEFKAHKKMMKRHGRRGGKPSASASNGDDDDHSSSIAEVLPAFPEEGEQKMRPFDGNKMARGGRRGGPSRGRPAPNGGDAESGEKKKDGGAEVEKNKQEVFSFAEAKPFRSAVDIKADADFAPAVVNAYAIPVAAEDSSADANDSDEKKQKRMPRRGDRINRRRGDGLRPDNNASPLSRREERLVRKERRSPDAEVGASPNAAPQPKQE